MPTSCSVAGCNRPQAARTYCATHYSTLWYRKQGRVSAYIRPCAWCGEQFSPNRNRQTARYCGKRCGAKAASYNLMVKGRHCRQRKLPVLFTGTYEPYAPAVTHVRTTNRLTSGQCRVCAAWFVSQHCDITCSSECRDQYVTARQQAANYRRRARLKTAFVSKVYRKRVFVNDGYRCHLCNRFTLPDKAVPHPRAPTIDHIVPLAQGGTHQSSNCRTACFQCNSTKGDRSMGDQLLLFN